VNLAGRLYKQFRQLLHEMGKFGVVGAVAFVVTFGGFNLLHYNAGLGPLTSNAIATAVATVVAFLGNRYWTFRHRSGKGMGRETVLFFVLNGVGLVIQQVCIGATRYMLGLEDKLSLNLALAVGIGLGTLFRFWSYRKWIWLAVEPPPIPDPAAMPGGEHESLEPAPAGAVPRPAARAQWSGPRHARRR
jgi:putative flippase GtrA